MKNKVKPTGQITQTTQIKKEKFLQFYSQDEVRGNISLTCDAIGIERKTYYNWLASDEDFRQLVKEAKLRMCDDMEQVLVSRAVEKDTTALIFWLKKNHETYRDIPIQVNQQFNAEKIEIVDRFLKEVKDETTP